MVTKDFEIDAMGICARRLSGSTDGNQLHRQL